MSPIQSWTQTANIDGLREAGRLLNALGVIS